MVVGTAFGVLGVVLHKLSRQWQGVGTGVIEPMKKMWLKRSRGVQGYDALQQKDEEAPDVETYSDVRDEEKRVLADTTSNYAVKLEHLSKSFDQDRVVVRDLTLGLRYGECFGLLGPNGAGKTTVINMLMGVLRPSSGNLHIAGRLVNGNNMTQRNRLVSVCPQHDVVWDDLTTEDHLLFYARSKGASNAQARAWAQQAAALVGLDGDAYNTTASGLSGGMRRRLSVAIAVLGGKLIFKPFKS